MSRYFAMMDNFLWMEDFYHRSFEQSFIIPQNLLHILRVALFGASTYLFVHNQSLHYDFTQTLSQHTTWINLICLVYFFAVGPLSAVFRLAGHKGLPVPLQKFINIIFELAFAYQLPILLNYVRGVGADTYEGYDDLEDNAWWLHVGLFIILWTENLFNHVKFYLSHLYLVLVCLWLFNTIRNLVSNIMALNSPPVTQKMTVPNEKTWINALAFLGLSILHFLLAYQFFRILKHEKVRFNGNYPEPTDDKIAREKKFKNY